MHTQREDKECKYQKKSVAVGLICKPSGVQSSRRSGRAEAVVRNTEKRVCTAFVNQWAANGEKQDEDREIIMVSFGVSSICRVHSVTAGETGMQSSGSDPDHRYNTGQADDSSHTKVLTAFNDKRLGWPFCWDPPWLGGIQSHQEAEES